MAQVYKHIGALHPRRTAFNNSYTKQFNCDMGQLIPVYCEEMIPGDHHTLGMEAVVRFQPMIAPLLHEVYLRTFFYFVPVRLLMNRYTMDDLGDDGEWEDFITGGPDGNDDTILPLWGSTKNPDGSSAYPFPTSGYGKYSLWDYFGFELNVVPTSDSMPISFNRRAYNLVWNEYFRDQNLQDEVSLDNDQVLNICWSKDRFTTALYDTQRGDRPAIPLSGITGISFDGPMSNNAFNAGTVMMAAGNLVANNNLSWNNLQATTPASQSNPTTSQPYGTNFKNWLNQNTLNFSDAVTFDVVDMRRLFQMQKYLERNMRSGARYTEQLRSRYNVVPQDMRLQRPEFIGGTRSPIIISEVLQTSESSTNSAQGSMAGHGIMADRSRVGKYHVKEHGYIIGLACVQPVPIYRHGINKQWTRRTRYDFPTPELVNLSEVAVYNRELVVTGTSRDDEIFGFQGIYDEMRIKESKVCADMRDTFSYWNLARDDFNKSAPPSLNENFIKCVPSKRIFAVQDEPGLIINFATMDRAVRPLPIIAEPGLIDHH